MNQAEIWQGTDGPWLRSVRAEYEALGLFAWDNDRVLAACKLFHCTIAELCGVCGVFSKNSVRSYVNIPRPWPAHLTVQFDKLLRFQSGLRSPHVQDGAAAQLIARSLHAKS